MVRQLMSIFRLDILFNNAGIAEAPALLHEMSTEQWRKVMDVDLDGVFYVAKAVLKVMLKQGSGKIINIGASQTPCCQARCSYPSQPVSGVSPAHPAYSLCQHTPLPRFSFQSLLTSCNRS